MKATLSCAQCIESIRLTVRSDPGVRRSASDSACWGTRGELSRREDSSGRILKLLPLVTFLNSVELQEGKTQNLFQTHRSEQNLTTTAADETKLGLFSAPHRLFSRQTECQIQENLTTTAGSFAQSKLVPLLRWRPRARLSSEAVCRPAPVSCGR